MATYWTCGHQGVICLSGLIIDACGWAALVGAYMVGPRLGKYAKGKVEAIPGHNKTLATLGVMALWFGWFGFNGGSQLAWGGDDTVAATTIVLFTNLSAAAGAVGALFTTWVWYGKPDIVQTLNGALAGLVSITAGAANMDPYGAFFAGLIGGVIVVGEGDVVVGVVVVILLLLVLHLLVLLLVE